MACVHHVQWLYEIDHYTLRKLTNLLNSMLLKNQFFLKPD